MSISDKFSKSSPDSQSFEPIPDYLTATSKWTITHLADFGGEVVIDHSTEEYTYSWGTLLKNDDIKWHDRKLSVITAIHILPYLEVLERDDLLGVTVYGLSRRGYALAECIKAVAK